MAFRQDMPPPGGYSPIYTHRTFPRIGSKTGNKIAVGVVLAATAGYYCYRYQDTARTRWLLEENDARMVASAFRMSERDRLWLQELRRVREEERELMKDVPGWRIGTFYGEPVYYTMPPGHWWDPYVDELYLHSSPYHLWKYNYWRQDVDIRGGQHWYDKYLPWWLADK